MLTGPKKWYELGGDNDVPAFNQTPDFQTTVIQSSSQAVTSQTSVKFLTSRPQSVSHYTDVKFVTFR